MGADHDRSAGDRYIDNWGLAGPGALGHRLGLGPILVGPSAQPDPPVAPARHPRARPRLLLVGLVWPYAFGPLGPRLGTYLTLLGALVLGAAAIACLVTDRHSGGPSDV